MKTDEIEKAISLVTDSVAHGTKIFQVAILDSGHFTNQYLAFPRDMESGGDYEVVYALLADERFPLLRRDESMYFQPVRDDSDSKGIVHRLY